MENISVFRAMLLAWLKPIKEQKRDNEINRQCGYCAFIKYTIMPGKCDSFTFKKNLVGQEHDNQPIDIRSQP